MIFFIGNDGTVVRSLPSPVYQGGTGTIYVVAPFAVNSEATAAFQLPNGVWTSRMPMAHVVDLPEEMLKYRMCIWSFDTDGSITRLYGTVRAQFFFYANGRCVASSATNFTVGRGVPEILTDEPARDVYKDILSHIASLRSDLENGYYAARAIYAWNETFTYGANEITFFPDRGEYGAFVKSIKEGNKGNSPYDEEGVLNAGWWEEVVDFNSISELYFDKVKMLVSEAEGHRDDAESAQIEAEEALAQAKLQADRAENAATNLENLVGEAIEYVSELPDAADAQFGKMYAVITDKDANFFDLYTLERTEDGSARFRYLGSENILANGIKECTLTLLAGTTGWMGPLMQQFAQIPEYDPSFHVDIFPADDSAVEYLRCKVRIKTINSSGRVLFGCRSWPTADLKIVVRMNVQFELPSVASYYTKPQTEELIEEERKVREAAEEALHKQIVQAEHFKGYFGTNAAILAAENADEKDYAWSAESHTVWIYGENGWVDSGVPVPDQTVPPAETLPLMDQGDGEVGVATKYARADHRHPEDKNKADILELDAEKRERGQADETLQNQIDNIQAIPISEIEGMFQ